MYKFSIYLSVLRVYWVITLFFASSSCGENEERQSLHPVDPAYAPRRQLSQTKPVYNISLYYAESDYQDRPHYASIISWYMRFPTVVAADHPEIRTVNCDLDGIHLEFASKNYKLKAEQWGFPLVVVLDGNTGRCASDDPDGGRYHPFYAESLLQSHQDQPTTLSLSGFRSRWDVVAYEHQVQVVEIKEVVSKTSGQADRVHQRRGLQAPTTMKISPSLNFDRNERKCSTSEVPISVATLENGSLEIKCKTCFLDSELQLSIYWASRIVNAGIKCINKILKNLYRAEQQLIELAGSAKHIVVSQFSKLSGQLADLISGFYNRVNDLAMSTDQTEQMKLKEELGKATTSVENTSSRLLGLTEGQLAIGIVSARISHRDAALAFQELKEIISSTSSELGLMMQSGTQLVIDELSLPLCTISQEKNFLRSGGFCRKRRKETSVRLTGRLRANFDVEINLTGTGEITNGDVTVLSVNLAGLQIPGILSVGPQARLISHTGLVFTSSAKLTLGAEAEWRNIDATIDGKSQKLSKLDNTNLIFRHHRPQFEINPQKISLEQHFKPQVTFGIELLLGSQELLAGIGGDIGLINTLQLPRTLSKKSQSCSDGLKYDFSVTAQLEAIMSVPSIPGLSILALFSSKAAALSQGSYPLLVAPNLTLVEHCFKVPTEFWSSFNRNLNRFTNTRDLGKLSSIEI
ncbi:hypothetical protein H4Q26_010946 [Puccinia striiformis f. sp. tritici PST-130]|uniref:Uncharacterized protein n=1 Tax=Puccinia striiformis f. sp. tritici PST-78 TaxID=1165861 RepID=A0A0L0W3S9_9BASI|nr:hypothetical protein Pst134EB_027358 [Puccinia striiformis f. sp. tritici]KAI9616549.1 hypothetical protein H4Q26_010946 [Puccinia striiformis f. sp. tritici PST-130]KNF06122.1 hypothetical protein PSTG_00630 [Puccinia striiformis f. sp. tritici PST-78]